MTRPTAKPKPSARSSAFELGYRAGLKAAAKALDTRAAEIATDAPLSDELVAAWRLQFDGVTLRNSHKTATHDCADTIRKLSPMPAPRRAPKDR